MTSTAATEQCHGTDGTDKGDKGQWLQRFCALTNPGRFQTRCH
jgi:hypothetical protein